MQEVTLTRRTFLKVAAVAGAAAAFSTSTADSLVEADKAFAASASERKMVKTACHGCIQMCPARVYLQDGVVVKIEGDPDGPISKGGLCLKGLNQMHTAYSPRHILHPMKRAGERGENKWEVISWDEAITLAATQITSIIDKYGPYSFFASVGGGGAFSFMQAMTLPMALGSPTVFEPGCAQCYLPRFSMAKFMYGGNDQSIADNGAVEMWNEYKKATKSLVLWAAQPSVSQVSESGRGMADLRARGCKTVVVDPNFSPDAAKADVWLPVRPGTDGALLLSWFRYIFENKLYDAEFTKYWTNLPFLINPDTKLPWEAKEVWPDYVSPTPANTPVYVCYDNKTKAIQPFPFSDPKKSPVDPEVFTTVQVNGKDSKTAGQIYKEAADPYTLEKAAEVCWLKADKIEEAIKIYTDPEVAGIANGVASDMTEIASQVPLGCMGLDMIMGYINKPGAAMTQQGLQSRSKQRPTIPWNGFGGMFGMMYGIGAIVGMSPEENAARVANYPNKEVQNFHLQLLIDRLGMVNHKGLYTWAHSHIPTVRDAIATGKPYKPRVWFDMSGNKLAMLGNASSWYEVFPQVDFIIGQYPMLTSFHVEAADLVFPLQEWLEWSGTPFGQVNYQFMNTDVIHLGETVSNGVPSQKVLDKCGEIWGKKMPPFLIEGENSEEEKHAGVAKAFGAKDWDDLLANQDKYVPKITPDEEYWQYDQHLDVVDDGLPAGFATESRKCEVYCSLLIKMGRTGYPFTYPREQKPAETGDYSPICQHIEPAESPLNDTEYPLVLTSGRLPYFHHGTMRHAAFSREICPAPPVKMNPKTAAKYGIKQDDWVKVTSRRGSTHGMAYVTEGVNPGVIWMERFWNPECFDSSQKTISGGWRECNVNVLTKNSAPFNEVFGSYTNRGFTVKIEKSTKPDRVWVEPKEFEPFLPTLMNEPQTKAVF
ncbi:MAG: molybdopterin-dependent oxidoreductase [Coriobacteriia bacterium]